MVNPAGGALGVSEDVEAAQPASTSARKISSKQVEVRFGLGAKAVHALGPFDLEVSEGEFVCLVGPSGCGKSTFIRLVAGLLEPTVGEITIKARGTSRAVTSMVFQDFGIFPWKSVEDNVALGLVAAGVKKREARERANEWVARLGLSDFRNAYPSALSGGMRQRVAIARALAVEPEILLMDEPFASLDAQLREILQEELLSLSQATSQTVIFVTHSLDEALVLGDRVVVMTARPGRLADAIEVPFDRPRDARVRESALFSERRSQLWDLLRGEVNAQIEQRRGEA